MGPWSQGLPSYTLPPGSGTCWGYPAPFAVSCRITGTLTSHCTFSSPFITRLGGQSGRGHGPDVDMLLPRFPMAPNTYYTSYSIKSTWNECMKRQRAERTNARELFWRRPNTSSLMTNFQSANICIVRFTYQAQGCALSLLPVCTPIPPQNNLTQLNFFSTRLHSASPCSHISHEQEVGEFSLSRPHPSLPKVLAILEELFCNTFDLKILDIILYIADGWPKIVGNNYQLAT